MLFIAFEEFAIYINNLLSDLSTLSIFLNDFNKYKRSINLISTSKPSCKIKWLNIFLFGISSIVNLFDTKVRYFKVFFVENIV